MATKKTQIQIKRNTNTNYNPGTITLREGEPFYNLPSEDFYVGNGQTPINALVPVNVKPVIATHTYDSAKHEHLFTINNCVGDLTTIPVITEFKYNYAPGETISLKIRDMSLSVGDYKEYKDCYAYTTLATALPEKGFAANTVSEFFIKLDAQPKVYFLVGGTGGEGPVEKTYNLTYNKNHANVDNNSMPANSTFKNTQAAVQINTAGKTPIDLGDKDICTGWTTTPTGEKVYALTGDSINPAPNRDVTLYAFWESKIKGSYTLSYAAGYTSDGMSGPLSSDNVSNLGEPRSFSVDVDGIVTDAIPTCAGYTFDCWKANGTRYNPGQVYTGRVDTLFTANWTRDTYAVQYYVDGIAQGAATTKQYRDTIILPTSPTKPGYTLKGWKLNNGSAIYSGSIQLPYIASKSIRFDAVYETGPVQKYTVHYDGNGGTYTTPIADQSYTAGTSVTVNFTHQPIATGKTFKGYKDGDGNSFESGGTTSFVINKDTILYAQWKKQYTLTYLANGGSGAPGSQTQDEDGVTTISSKVPTRNGFVFKGWSRQSSATTASYQPGDKVTLTEDTTLYAIWASIVYKYTYSSTYGTPPGGSTTNTNKQIQVSAPTDTMKAYAADAGKVFAGWQLNGGIVYPAGDQVVLSAGDNTLKAVFESVTKTVTGMTGETVVVSFEETMTNRVELIYTPSDSPVSITKTGDKTFNATFRTSAVKGAYAIYKFVKSECDDEYFIKFLVSGESIQYKLNFSSQYGTPPSSVTVTDQLYRLPDATESMKTSAATNSIPKVCVGWTVNNITYGVGEMATLSAGDNSIVAIFSSIANIVTMPPASSTTYEYKNGAEHFVEYATNGCVQDIISSIKWDPECEDGIVIESKADAEQGDWALYQFDAINGDTDFILIKISGAKLYRLTYDLQGHGSSSYPKYQDVEEGKRAVKPTDPTDPNYTFRGWFTNSACTMQWTWTPTITSDMTIYAKWDTNILVKFYADEDGTELFTTRSVPKGDMLIIPSDVPTISGFKFTGWEHGSDIYQPEDRFPKTGGLTEDTVLYPIFESESNYIIRYAMYSVQGTPPADDGATLTSPAYRTQYPTDSMIVVADADQEVLVGWLYNDRVYAFGYQLTLNKGVNQFTPVTKAPNYYVGLPLDGPSENFKMPGGIDGMKIIYAHGTTNAFDFVLHNDCEECEESFITCRCTNYANMGDFAVLELTNAIGTFYLRVSAIRSDTQWKVTYRSTYGAPPVQETYPHKATVTVKGPTASMTDSAAINGFKFVNWYAEADCECCCEDEEVEPGSTFVIASNVFYDAHFEQPSYKMTFASSLGDAPSPISGQMKVVLPTETYSMATAATAANKSFLGWGTDPDCDDVLKAGDVYNLSVNKPTQTLHAVFMAIKYNVNLTMGADGELEVPKAVKSITEVRRYGDVSPVSSIRYEPGCQAILYTASLTGVDIGNYAIYSIVYTDGSEERVKFTVSTGIQYKYRFNIYGYDPSFEVERTSAVRQLTLPDISTAAKNAAANNNKVFTGNWTFDGGDYEVGGEAILQPNTTNEFLGEFSGIDSTTAIHAGAPHTETDASYTRAQVLYADYTCGGCDIIRIAINSQKQLVVTASASAEEGDFVIVKTLSDCGESIKRFVVAADDYWYNYYVNDYDKAFQKTRDSVSSTVTLLDCSDIAKAAAISHNKIFSTWKFGNSIYNPGAKITIKANQDNEIKANYISIDRTTEVNIQAKVTLTDHNYTSMQVIYASDTDAPSVYIKDNALVLDAECSAEGDITVVLAKWSGGQAYIKAIAVNCC